MDTLLENIRLLLGLYVSPLRSMSGILDKGSLIFSVVAASVLSVLLQVVVIRPFYQAQYEQFVKAQMEEMKKNPPVSDEENAAADEPEEISTIPPEVMNESGGLRSSFIYSWMLRSLSPFSVFSTLLTLALLYVPGTLLAITLIDLPNSFSVVIRRDYGSLLLCTLMAWAAAQLPPLIVGYALMKMMPGQSTMYGIQAGGLLLFALLMICALRVIFGTSFGKAALTISLSWLATLLNGVLLYLASPFLLYYLWFYVRGDVGDMRWSFISGRSYRRYLEASTINPHDAEAQYELGMIHLQRHQISEAAERFKQAVKIDQRETDAHFQLGRIAREQGRLSEAIEHFNLVVAQNENHAMGDVWREVGATYLTAGMAEEARSALEKFITRREHDPEGLYYLGETYNKLGLMAEAQAAYSRCIEAADTMPYYRRREVSKWRRLAQKQKS
jgi:Tfp pilus assembly protein PilF